MTLRHRTLEIGCPVPRVDAAAKVTGEEKYAIDHTPGNMLWAGVRRAGVPHGRLRTVHVEEARALPGVLCVLTAADVPGTNRQGIIHKDQPVLAGDRVRHCGDPVALVLAEDRETLAKALALVVPDIEPLPSVHSPEEALRPDAPAIHDSGNVLLQAVIEKGDASSAFGECDAVVEETFAVPFQEHAFLETQNGIAHREADGKLVMTVSTQAPFRDRFEIAQALGLDPLSIRIISPYLGGGFGGKDGATVQCLLALAAMHAGGRPVRMTWEREESFIAGYKRHAVKMHYRVGAKRDGTLHALECDLYYDTGAYAHLGAEVMELGMEHAGGPYRIPNVRVKGWCVYTNNPIAGAMRGFGVCQTTFAVESVMDMLAAKLTLEPLEFRRKNALRRGDENCAGVTMVHSTGIGACLETLGRHPLWLERRDWRRAAPPFKRRGVGLAAVFNAMGYGRGLPDSAIARLELTLDGRIRIYCGVSDMGQGNSAAFVQIAGGILCQDASRLELILPDTDRTHPSGSSSAGRTTYTFGNALVQACNALKEKLFHRAALVLMLDEEKGLALLPGRVRHLPSGREASFELLARMLPEADRASVGQFIMPVAHDVPDTGKEFVIGFPHVFFAYAAHLARVEVDELTGKIEVTEYLAVTDGGKVINPQGFEQQVHGSVAQGLGYALTEQLLLDRGAILNAGFADYILPTALDVPEIISVAAETFEHTGPFGMKGIGEVGTNGPLPAVANAVNDALGRRLTRSPLTASRVLRAMEEGPAQPVT